MKRRPVEPAIEMYQVQDALEKSGVLSDPVERVDVSFDGDKYVYEALSGAYPDIMRIERSRFTLRCGAKLSVVRGGGAYSGPSCFEIAFFDPKEKGLLDLNPLGINDTVSGYVGVDAIVAMATTFNEMYENGYWRG